MTDNNPISNELASIIYKSTRLMANNIWKPKAEDVLKDTWVLPPKIHYDYNTYWHNPEEYEVYGIKEAGIDEKWKFYNVYKREELMQKKWYIKSWALYYDPS